MAITMDEHTNEHAIKVNCVALLTDLGTKDCSAASLEAAILRKNFNMRVIHMSHAVPSGSISTAAMFLEIHYRNYPTNTVFVAVVGSETGENNRIIFARRDEYYFIGLDNGIFTQVFKKTRPHQIIELNQKHFHSENALSTIISAAVLSNRFMFSDLGESIPEKSVKKLDPFVVIQNGKLVTKVLCINNRGDLITGLTEKEFKGFTNGNNFGMMIDSEYFDGFSRSSTGLSEHIPRLLFNGDSGGYGTIAMKKNSAKKFTGADIGTEVAIFNVERMKMSTEFMMD